VLVTLVVEAVAVALDSPIVEPLTLVTTVEPGIPFPLTDCPTAIPVGLATVIDDAAAANDEVVVTDAIELVESTAVTVYPEIGDPPLLVGAVQLTVMPVPVALEVTVTPDEAPGALTGTWSEAVSAAESPMREFATTLKVYAAPGVRPVNVHPVEALAPVQTTVLPAASVSVPV